MRKIFWLVLFLSFGCGIKLKDSKKASEASLFELVKKNDASTKTIAGNRLLIDAQVIDANKQPVPGANIFWAITGNGSLRFDRTTTDDAGSSINYLLTSQKGKSSIFAKIEDSEKQITWEVEATPRESYTIVKKNEGNLLKVFVKDLLKQPVVDAEINWTTNSSMVSLKDKSTKTGKDGSSSNTITLPKTNGSYTVVAKTTGSKPISATFSFTVKKDVLLSNPNPSPNPLPKLVVSGPEAVLTGFCGEYTVSLNDQSNQPIQAETAIPLRFRSNQGFFTSSYESCLAATTSIVDNTVAFAVDDFSKKFYWRAGSEVASATLQVGASNKAAETSIQVNVVQPGSSGSVDLSFGSPATPGFIHFLDDVAGNFYENTGNFWLNSVAIQPDNKIILLGATAYHSFFSLKRVDKDGKIDSSFATHERGSLFDSFFARPLVIVSQHSDSAIFIGGSVATDVQYDVKIAMARLDKDGHLDSAFGSQGRISTNLFDNKQGQVESMAPLGDGSSLVFIKERDWIWLGDSSEIWKVTANGTIDTTFGGSPKQTQFKTRYVHGGIFELADQRFLAIYLDENYRVAIRKFQKNGILDTSFGPLHDGKVQASIKREGSDVDARNFSGVNSDGSILILGYISQSDSFASPRDTYIMKFDANGNSDTSFGGGMGRVKIAEGTNSSASFNETTGELLTLMPDGRILAAGYKEGTKTICTVQRFLASGAVDTSFGQAGIITLDDCIAPSEGYFKQLLVQEDGRILLHAVFNYAHDFIMRLLP